MTGESVKDCRWCEKCKGYHPPTTKCTKEKKNGIDRLARILLIIIVILSIISSMVYWFRHPYLTQMELLIEKWPLFLILFLGSILLGILEVARDP